MLGQTRTKTRKRRDTTAQGGQGGVNTGQTRPTHKFTLQSDVADVIIVFIVVVVTVFVISVVIGCC